MRCYRLRLQMPRHEGERQVPLGEFVFYCSLKDGSELILVIA